MSSVVDFDYLDQVGFKEKYLVSSQPETMDFFLENVKCSRCLSQVEGVANDLNGVLSIQMNLGSHVARVEIDDSVGKFSQVAKSWMGRGFAPHPIASREDFSKKRDLEIKTQLNRLAVAGVLAGNIMLFSFANYFGASGKWTKIFDWMAGGLFLGILLYCSSPFLRSAWVHLKERRASIDLPIALSVLIGAALSYFHLIVGRGDVYFDSLATLVFLILASRFILSVFQKNLLAPSYFKDFFKLRAVKVVPRGHEKSFNGDLGGCEKVSVEDVCVGDLILLEQGETIPVDGTVEGGPDFKEVWIDSSVVTGEFLAEKKARGSLVLAGSICESPELFLRAKSNAVGSHLGKLIADVEDQLLKKTPLISFTDRLAQYFTLTVLSIGVVFAAFYFWIDASEALNRSLALVILACPCALAFATPLSQSLSLAKLARARILVKKAEVLERLSSIDTVVFDKTGTLSEGKLSFLGWQGGEPSRFEKEMIYELERGSTHPVARTFRLELSSYQDGNLPISDRREVVGKGVSGIYQGETYSVRAVKLPVNASINSSDSRVDGRVNDRLNDLESSYLNVGLYKGDELLCHAKLGDVKRKGVFETIRSLMRIGKEIYVVSGDKEASVKSFSQNLGLSNDRVLAEVSPKGKGEFLKQHPNSLMVGDGANDLLAMSGSQVSIAVKGSIEASLHIADVYVAKSGVDAVAELFLVGQESMKVIRRNLGISLVYNLVAGGAALLGYVNPLVAAVLMPLSSVAVVLSAVYGTKEMRRFSKETRVAEERI